MKNLFLMVRYPDADRETGNSGKGKILECVKKDYSTKECYKELHRNASVSVD